MISMAGVLCRLSDHFPVQLEESDFFYQAFYAFTCLAVKTVWNKCESPHGDAILP